MKNYVILFCIIFISIGLKANNILSSFLTYNYDKDNVIKTTLLVNTECKYGTLSGMEGVIYNDNNSDSIVFLFSSKTQKDMTPKCNSYEKSICEDSLNNNGEGMYQYIFTSNIALNDPLINAWRNQGACKIYIGWRAITNSNRTLSHNNGLSGSKYYGENMIDLCMLQSITNKFNVSPTTGKNNINISCIGKSSYFNNSCIDLVEHDSISYELVKPLSGHGTFADYIVPYTENNPLTSQSIYLDSRNGDLVIYGPTKPEKSLTTIKVSEWRKNSNGVNVLIGYQIRDIFLQVKDCGLNWPPEIKSVKYDYVITERDVLVIDVYGTDTIHPSDTVNTKLDTVSMKWNIGIPLGNFKILDPYSRNKHGQFIWKPRLGDAQNTPYTFTVTVEDDNCPLKATSIRGFSVKVNRLYPVGIGEINSKSLNLYPNPIKDKVTITLHANEKYQTVRILSMDGKVLYDAEVQTSSATLELNSSFLSKGVYMIELYTENGIFRGRVIKE